MEHTASGRPYLSHVDGLRAVAVLAVVLFHAEVPYFTGGFVGVDVFFVISGFLITRNILDDIDKGEFVLWKFYFSRLRRLGPALLFAILVTFALGFLIFSPLYFADLGKTTINALLSLSNIFFWQDADYFAIDSRYVALLHTWSLSVEEQFYAVWPLFLLAFTGAATRNYLVPALIAVGGISLIAAVWVVSVDPGAGFYLMPFRMFEFGLGAACIWLLRYRELGPLQKEVLAVAGLAAIAAAVVLFDSTTPFPSYNALLPAIGTVLLIVYGSSRFTGTLLRSRLAVGFGLISYSLYLFHWPLLVYGRYLKLDALSAAETALAIMIAILLSVFTYFAVEQPFRKLHLWRIQIRPVAFVVGCLSVTLLGTFLGAHAWGGNGWKFRLDREERTLIRNLARDLRSPCRIPSLELDNAGFQCEFGARRRPGDQVDVMLLGDSHARHWLPGLNRLLLKAGLSGAMSMGGGSMPFVIGRSMNAERFYFDFSGTYAHVRKNPPPLVILAGRWAVPAFVRMPEGGEIWFGLDGFRRETPESSRKALFVAANQTLKELETLGSRVLVLGQVPYAGVDQLDCRTRPKFLSFLHREALCVGITSEKVLMRDRVMAEFFEGAAKRHANTRYVPIAPRMCQGRHCTKVVDGTVLYGDDDHLSYQGSVYLAETFLADYLK